MNDLSEYFKNPSIIISFLKKMLNPFSDDELILLIDNSEYRIVESSYDNWNGGTYGYTLDFIIPYEVYIKIIGKREKYKEDILQHIRVITEDFQNEFFEGVSFIPATKTKIEISKLTRRDIFDYIQMNNIIWNGRLSEPDFLKRIYDLEKMESYDSRFPTAEADIWQHRINNEDWDDYWIFDDDRFSLIDCEDELLLKFLCEMIHPVVRNEIIEVNRIKQTINSLIINDGFELFETTRISNKPIFSGRKIINANPISLEHVKDKVEKLNADYISKQIIRIESAIMNDPALAIGSSKELVESCCKTILNEYSIEYSNNETLPKLVKLVSKELKLTPDDISNESKASETIKRILSNLAAVTNGIAELRNSYGSGHGKDGKYIGLSPRHAKLAAGAASTLAIFLFETFDERNET